MYYWRKPPREVIPQACLILRLTPASSAGFVPSSPKQLKHVLRRMVIFLHYFNPTAPPPHRHVHAHCNKTSALPLPLLTGESPVSCPATAVTVSVEFSTLIASAAHPGTAYSTFSPAANAITFIVESLASNPTKFSLVLDTTTTTDFPSGAGVVSQVIYSDIEGNSPDMSSLFTLSSTLECNEGAGEIRAGDNADAAADSTAHDDVAPMFGISRTLQEEEEEEEEEREDFDCSPCGNLSEAELEELAKYEDGGKLVFCDPTCLDEGADLTHCNCE